MNEPFLRQCLQCLETQMARVAERLDAETDLLDSKVMQLHRVYHAKLRAYLTVDRYLEKPSATPPSLPEIPIPDSWLADPVVFAREALHLELYEHQKQLALSERRVNLLIAGRGAGKSQAACVIALHRALAAPRHIVLVVSSGQRMSSGFGDRILDLVRESPLRGWIKTLSTERVIFHNRSAIYFLPANPDTIRGYHPRLNRDKAGITVILDEACFMEQGDEIRKAVEYALITATGEKGRLYVVSSPSSTGSWVYAYAQNAHDPAADTAVFQCPSSANPAISPEEIERLRKTKNEMEFRAEVLGEWVDGAWGLFAGLIDSNRIPDEEATAEDDLPPEAVCALGADLALSFGPGGDRNALAVVARWFPDDDPDSEARYRLMAVEHLDRASDGDLRAAVGRLVDRYGVECAWVEQYQGKGLYEYCQSLEIEAQLIAPTPGQQQTAFHELHRLLRQNRLELPASLPAIFFEEMKAFEYRREPNGHISFGHPAGAHDDTVYALAWAVQAAQSVAPRPAPFPIAPLIHFIPRK